MANEDQKSTENNDEKANAKDFPKIYYARHMQPGVCGYENETILVDTDAVKAMLPSAIGKPVYIHHDTNTNEQRLADLKDKAAGYITDAFWNDDGWAWFKIIVVDDDAKHCIDSKWSCSNAYIPTEFANGGTKNNVPYDREVLNGEFTHLAIVPNPRYENACVMTPFQYKTYQESEKAKLAELQNSKPASKGKPMFNFFKTEKKPVTDVDMDTTVEIKNDKGEIVTVTMAEMVNAVQKKNDDKADKGDEKDEDKEKEAMNDDSMIKVGDEEMTLGELKNRYQKMASKKNADDEEDAKNKKEAEEKAKKDEEKSNAVDKDQRYYDELCNANRKAFQDRVEVIETIDDGVRRGKERYGK